MPSPQESPDTTDKTAHFVLSKLLPVSLIMGALLALSPPMFGPKIDNPIIQAIVGLSPIIVPALLVAGTKAHDKISHRRERNTINRLLKDVNVDG